MDVNEYRRNQAHHQAAKIAVSMIIQFGVSLREVIRSALPKLSNNQLRGIRRLLDGIIASREVRK